MTAHSYDPLNPEVRRDPYPHYLDLRRKAPVTRIESTGFWAVATHREVLEVFRNPDAFSSSAMRFIDTNGRPPVNPMEQLGSMTPEEMAKFIAALPFPPLEMMAARSVIFSDPPVHDALRAIVNRGFTPRKIAALEPRVRAITRDCLADARRKGELELMRDLAIPVPVTVIAEMLGVDPERRDDFKRWSDAIVTSTTGVGGRRRARSPEVMELFKYLAQVIEQRRQSPRDDLISTLLRAEDGQALKPVEVVMFTLLLLVAGNETTTNLVGNIGLALTQNPGEQARVHADPALVPLLVEEGLRFDPPAQAMYRETTRAVELGGVSIAKGEIVVPLIGSANRDEGVFPGGDRFEVRRDRPNHVAFGFGVHFCLGASLARLEARVMLEELLQLGPIARKPGSDYERLDSFMLRGLRSLPLVLSD